MKIDKESRGFKVSSAAFWRTASSLVCTIRTPLYNRQLWTHSTWAAPGSMPPMHSPLPLLAFGSLVTGDPLINLIDITENILSSILTKKKKKFVQWNLTLTHQIKYCYSMLSFNKNRAIFIYYLIHDSIRQINYCDLPLYNLQKFPTLYMNGRPLQSNGYRPMIRNRQECDTFTKQV